MEHFITWSKRTFPKKRAALEEIEKQIQGKTREIQTNNQPILDWYGIGVLVFLPFLPIYYFWAKSVFDKLSTAGKAKEFLCSWPFLILAAFVLGTLALAFWKYKFGSGKERHSDFKTAISRMLLISSRQHQDHKVVQKVREIDPNDYEFHATLREILGTVQTENDRVVMVLDNIDRLPRKEIMEYWALVRSVFLRTHDSSKHDSNTDITAIVPYDRKLIEASVNEEEPDSSEGETSLSSLASRELFSKTFDEILVVAPPVLSNARDFFADKLNQALPKQVSPDDRFRTYRIFCELLNVESGTTTPRQIVSFVNDLSSLYELHDGKFQLPTVAAYLAHQDLLTVNPVILNTDSGLDPKIASLTADEGLVRNLAAMVFNVEEDLAFQILLDDEIAKAVVAETPDALGQLSKAPGFDLRVDDVVQANLDEWRSTAEFGKAVENFSDLFGAYKGDAKKHVANSLLNGFKRVESLSVEDEEYLPFMALFEIATEVQRLSVITHFVDAAFVDINQQETNLFQNGKNLASFVKATKDALERLGAVEGLTTALGQQSLPSSPEFVFGLGASIADAGFGLRDFDEVEVIAPEDSEYFEEQFVRFPGLAIQALVQFQTCNLLSDDEWLSIANACLTALKDAEAEPENVGNLLEVVSMAWQNIDDKRRSEIELEDALTDGEFFRNVGEGQTEASRLAQTNLLFLAQEKLGETLPDPTKLNANNAPAADSSDAFEIFRTILEGGAEVEESQVKLIAQKAIEAARATRWINFGKKNREHVAAEQIVLAMFRGGNPPYLNLSGLLSQFAYVAELLDTDDITTILGTYSGRVKPKELAKLEISDLPSGFLDATHAVGNGHWDALHQHVDQLLISIAADAWPDHIEGMDHTVAILIEKLRSSGCSLDSGELQ